MKDHACIAAEVHTRVLDHLLMQIEKTNVIAEPFSHFYLEEVFPEDIYEQMLIQLPVVDLYHTCHNHQGSEGDYMRATFELSRTRLPELPTDQEDLWRGIASVLTAPELKQAVYRRLAKGMAFRFGVAKSNVEQIPGFAKPTLYRETTALARRIADGPRVAYGYIKRNLFAAETESLAAVLEMEAVHQARTAMTEDHLEASRAFVEKRRPVRGQVSGIGEPDSILRLTPRHRRAIM